MSEKPSIFRRILVAVGALVLWVVGVVVIISFEPPRLGIARVLLNVLVGMLLLSALFGDPLSDFRVRFNPRKILGNIKGDPIVSLIFVALLAAVLWILIVGV